MKILSLTITILMSSNLMFAQEQPKIEDKIIPLPIENQYKSRTTTTTLIPTQNKTVTISKKAGEPQRVHDVAYYQEEIAKIDAHIQAINTKIQFIQNNPAENSLANQNGWYTSMEEIKNKLNTQKAIYQQKLN